MVQFNKSPFLYKFHLIEDYIFSENVFYHRIHYTNVIPKLAMDQGNL